MPTTVRGARMRLLVMLGLVACSKTNVRDVVGLAPTLAGNRVAVAEPQWLRDLEAPVDDMGSFRANTWSGTIWFRGGFEVLPEEDNQVRSVEVDLGDAEAYRTQARRWAIDTVQSAARAAGWQVVGAELPSLDVVAPERQGIRGTVPFDGDDNLNLPRFDLVPRPLTVGDPIEGVDAVLVPVLVHYYAHNSGWFIGQEKGTWAGARVRLLWSLYEASSGALLGWGDVGTKAETEALASPNRQQLEDLLLEAESEAAKRLEKQLSGA